MSTEYEVADIINNHINEFYQVYNVPYSYKKVLKNITGCRTSAMGGHVYECDECGHLHVRYNSCRDRHCPKCGYIAKEKWLINRKADLLPVPYFHIVFTVPDLLNDLIIINKNRLLNLIFKSASHTLLKLGNDQKHLGAEIGFIAILHTWGQNLMFHPHLHCILPAGGIEKISNRWIYPKKAKQNKKFFIHVNIISDLFKKIFICYLRDLYYDNELAFCKKTVHLTKKTEFNTLIKRLYNMKWVTYCKRPFGGPEQVLEYIGRYTHRVAITNNRIKFLNNDKVTFEWRDYKDHNKIKLMTIDAVEFIRRFLLHVLPRGFFKIRYYGILGSRNKSTKLKTVKRIFASKKITADSNQPKPWYDVLFQNTGIDALICPNCHKGRLVMKNVLSPVPVAPT